MEILVTTSAVPTWTGEVFSINLGNGAVVQVGSMSDVEVCGMDIYEGDIYCVSYSKGSLVVYDKDYKLKWQKIVGSVGLHSIQVVNKKIFVTDSHVERIVILDLLGDELEVITVPQLLGYGTKRAHVNATALHEGDLYYIVRFMGGGIDAGFVMNKNHKPIIAGLKMPHSLLIRNGYIYFCNSWKFTLEKYTLLGEFISGVNLGDYTRGLCWIEKDLWAVGLSCQRGFKGGKETSRDRASIVIVEENEEKKNWRTLKFVDLPNSAKEIFEIVKKEE